MTRHSKQKRARRRMAVQAAVILSLVLVISLYFGLLASAQNTYTIIDGDDVTVYRSATTDISQVLDLAGIQIGEEDLVTTEDSGSGTQVLIQRCMDVTVRCGDEEYAASTYDSTVGALLSSLEIELGEADTLASDGQSLSAADTLYDGMEIDITRNTRETVTETVEIPYETVTYLDPTLAEGVEEIKTAGVAGQQETTYLQEYVNGELVSSTATGTKLVSAPVTEVVLIGSGTGRYTEAETQVETEPEEEEEPEDAGETEAVAEPETASVAETETGETEAETKVTGTAETSEDSSVQEDTSGTQEDASEDASAASEDASSDTSAAASGNTITTADGEVLTYSSVLSVEATAYTGGGTTATGTAARYGAIAVDPTVIPYGTKMYIVSDDGKWIYGVATAEDCGGAIKGYIIDLYFDDYNTCIQFGRRNCTVYILE